MFSNAVQNKTIKTNNYTIYTNLKELVNELIYMNKTTVNIYTGFQ